MVVKEDGDDVRSRGRAGNGLELAQEKKRARDTTGKNGPRAGGKGWTG
jgi:hypothetical protein